MLCFSCFLIIYTCTKLLSTTFLVKISLILIFFFLIDCLLIYLFRSDVQANLFHSSAFLDMFHMGFCAKKRCRFVDMCFRNNFCRVVRPCISQIIFWPSEFAMKIKKRNLKTVLFAVLVLCCKIIHIVWKMEFFFTFCVLFLVFGVWKEELVIFYQCMK